MINTHDDMCPKASSESAGVFQCLCSVIKSVRYEEREVAAHIANRHLNKFTDGFNYSKWQTMIHDILSGEEL